MEGYKTYLVAAVMGGATFLLNLGIITQEAFEMIMPFLTALGLAALRNGMPKKPVSKAKKLVSK